MQIDLEYIRIITEMTDLPLKTV